MPFYGTAWPPNEPDSWPLIVKIMKASPFPGMTVTSTQRDGNSDYHDFGMAVDFARPMDAAGRGVMRDFAAWLYERSEWFIELIHTTPFDTDNGFYVKNGVRRPPGFYGAATEAAHDNHVHVSMSHRGATELLATLSAPTLPPSGENMVEYAPESLKWLGKQAPGLGGVLSGIVGDSAHTYGYHRGRNFVSSGDYSAVLAEDRAGDGNAASAIDINFPAAKMKVMTQRLVDAAARKDPRMRFIREFYGTTNGTSVTGRTHNGENAPWSGATSDDSHLWHIHISFFRKYATSMDAAKGIHEILAAGAASPGSSVEDDDMPIGLGPVELPKGPNTHCSYTIYPVNVGALKWGPAYLSVGGDLFGGKAVFRIVSSAGDGKWAMVKERAVIESGKLYNTQLATGTRILSISRVPVDAADPCTSSVSMSIEYGTRA